MSRFSDGEDIFDAVHNGRTDSAEAIANSRLEFVWEEDGDIGSVHVVLPSPYRSEWIGSVSFDWTRYEWDFIPLDPSGNPVTERQHVFDIGERESQDTLRRQHADALNISDNIVRDAAIAELDGRIRFFRDETKPLAVLGTKMQTKSWMQRYFCTGFPTKDLNTGEPDGGTIHDGNTCPLHETGGE